MFTAFKFLGILVGIKLLFDLLSFAIIETYYAHRGWISGMCTYGVDNEGNILSGVPNKLVKILMDIRGWEYIAGYKFIWWLCVRLTHFKGKA